MDEDSPGDVVASGDLCVSGSLPALVTVAHDQFMQLLELAEEALELRDTEFGSYPSDRERKLMLSFYRLVDREVPSKLAWAFKRSVAFTNSEVEPDE